MHSVLNRTPRSKPSLSIYSIFSSCFSLVSFVGRRMTEKKLDVLSKCNFNQLESLLQDRGYIYPAFSLYGGSQGLYDFGPLGAKLKNEIINYWRKLFVHSENNLEIDCTMLTPENVFIASGHVAKFSDFVTYDTVTGTHYRADHLMKSVLRHKIDLLNIQLEIASSNISNDESKLTKFLKMEGKGNRIAYAAKDSNSETSLLVEPKNSQSQSENIPSSQYLANQIPCIQQSIQDVNRDLDLIEGADKSQLSELFKKYSIKSPDTGNELSELEDFNLMFKSQLGPISQKTAYLRPETAQGMFLNFPKLFAYNQEKLPFGAVQIGKSFRNEIAPRGGLLRAREFDMAEIEYFIDPECDKVTNFSTVSNMTAVFLSQKNQLDENLEGSKKLQCMSIQEAYDTNLLSSQTLAYYIAKTQIFLENIGISKDKVRFRQHLPNEMAHYASECWDGEIFIDDDWVECVGIANRCSYDLDCHAKATGKNLKASISLDKPYSEKKITANCTKKIVYDNFKSKSKSILNYFANASQKELSELMNQLNVKKSIAIKVDGQIFELDDKMVKIEHKDHKITTKQITPQVIEPSFGIGRIITAVLEHCCLTRESDKDRVVFNFPAIVAPIKVSIFTLQRNTNLKSVCDDICFLLGQQGIAHSIDTSGASIGKRYTRSDMQGIPFAITIDFQTLENEDKSVTLRERNTTKQLRVPFSDILMVIMQLVSGIKSWSQIQETYPSFSV